MGRIVVGWDGSETAYAALLWAAEAAGRGGHDVEVVRSWFEPIVGGPSLYEAWEDPDAEERKAKAELDEAVQGVASSHDGVHFTTALVSERAASAILTIGEGAELIVLGARGRGGFASLLLGSVSQRVAAEADTTVVVVRGAGRVGGEVVVGVDGSESGRQALAWAAGEAARRGVPLHAVMAWNYLFPQGEHGPEPFRASYTQVDAVRTLRTIIHDVLGADPVAEVHGYAVNGLAARELVERSSKAALVVVGPRDSSRHARFELGSVSIQVLHHAACPVAIVRSPKGA